MRRTNPAPACNTCARHRGGGAGCAARRRAAGAIFANSLGWPLDVVLTKKIGQPEYAVGAVSLESVVPMPGVVLPDGYLNEQVARIRHRLQQRHQAYVGNRPPLVLTGRTVVLVDDGLAIGHPLLATVELVRQQALAHVMVAVPMPSPQALGRLQAMSTRWCACWSRLIPRRWASSIKTSPTAISRFVYIFCHVGFAYSPSDRGLGVGRTLNDKMYTNLETALGHRRGSYSGPAHRRVPAGTAATGSRCRSAYFFFHANGTQPIHPGPKRISRWLTLHYPENHPAPAHHWARRLSRPLVAGLYSWQRFPTERGSHIF